MSRRRGSRDRISADRLQAALGNIMPPDGDLDRLADAVTRRWPPVMRHRREVSVADLPVATKALPWYRLARRARSDFGDASHDDPPADDSPPRVSRHLMFAAGDYYLQDAGSLLPLSAADADGDSLRGKAVCDLCAAPGGKATALVEAVGDNGFVLANEPIRSRLPPLQFNLARTGSDRWAVSSMDPEILARQLGDCFDLVLVDAPCSGQALLSRGRQTESAISQKQIRHCAMRQQRILEAARALVRAGGRLVYSTCTFAEQENEIQVERLASSQGWGALTVDRLRPYRSDRGWGYRLWPTRDACAGSFAAVLERDDNDSYAPQASPPPDSESARGRPAGVRRGDSEPVFSADWRQWISVDERKLRLVAADAAVFAWPTDVPHWVCQVSACGPELAHRTGQVWKPAHAAALRRVERGRPQQYLEVTAESARRFLCGETIECRQRGWLAVRWNGKPLGWVKSDGRQGKNQLPKSARFAAGQIWGGEE